MYTTRTGCTHCDTVYTGFQEHSYDDGYTSPTGPLPHHHHSSSSSSATTTTTIPVNSLAIGSTVLPTSTTMDSISSSSSSSSSSVVPSTLSAAETVSLPSPDTSLSNGPLSLPSSSSASSPVPPTETIVYSPLYTRIANDYSGNGNPSSYWECKVPGYSLQNLPTSVSTNTPLPVPIARIPVTVTDQSWSYSPSLLLAAAAACTPSPIDFSTSLAPSSSVARKDTAPGDNTFLSSVSYLYSGSTHNNHSTIPSCRSDDQASLASIETWTGIYSPNHGDLQQKMKCYDHGLLERVLSKSILTGWLNILSPTMDQSTTTISNNTSATPYDGATGKWLWLPRFVVLTRSALWLFTATDNQLLSVTSNTTGANTNSSSGHTGHNGAPPLMVDPNADRPYFRTAQRAFLHGDSHVVGINSTDFQFYTEHQMLMFRSSAEQETATWILHIQSGIALRRPFLSASMFGTTPTNLNPSLNNPPNRTPSNTCTPSIPSTDTVGNPLPVNHEPTSSSSHPTHLPPSLLLLSDNDILGYADHYESNIIENINANVLDDPMRTLLHSSSVDNHHSSYPNNVTSTGGNSSGVSSDTTTATKIRTNSVAEQQQLPYRRKSSVAQRTMNNKVTTFANEYSNNPLARSLTYRMLQSFGTRLRLRSFVRRLMPEHASLIRAWEHIQVYVSTHPSTTNVPCTCGLSTVLHSSESRFTDPETYSNYQRVKLQALAIAGRFLFSQDAIPLPSGIARELFALMAKYGITVEALAIANSLLSENYYNHTIYDSNSTDEEYRAHRQKMLLPLLPPADLFATAQAMIEECICIRILIPYSRTQLSRVTTARKMVVNSQSTMIGSKTSRSNSGALASLGSFALKRLSISIDSSGSSMNSNKNNYNSVNKTIMNSSGNSAGRRSSLFTLPGTSLLSPSSSSSSSSSSASTVSSSAVTTPGPAVDRRTTRAGSIFSSPGRKLSMWSGFLSPANDNDLINSNIFNENDPLNKVDNGDDLDNLGVNSNTIDIFTPAIIEPSQIPLQSLYALCDVEMINQPLANIIGQNEVYFLTNLLPTFIIANRTWKYAWSRVLGPNYITLPEFGIGSGGIKKGTEHKDLHQHPSDNNTLLPSTTESSGHHHHHHHHHHSSHDETLYHPTCGHYRVPSAIMEWTGKKHGLSIKQLTSLLTVPANRIDDILDDLDIPHTEPVVSRRSFTSSNLMKSSVSTTTSSFSANPTQQHHHHHHHHHHSKTKHDYVWYKAWLDTNEHTLPAVKRALQDTVIDAILMTIELCEPRTPTSSSTTVITDTINNHPSGESQHHHLQRVSQAMDVRISTRSLQNIHKYGKLYESLHFGTTVNDIDKIIVGTKHSSHHHHHPSVTITLPKPLDIRPFIIRPGHPLLSMLADTIHPHIRIPHTAAVGMDKGTTTSLPPPISPQLNGLFLYPFKHHYYPKVSVPLVDNTMAIIALHTPVSLNEFGKRLGISSRSFSRSSVTVVARKTTVDNTVLPETVPNKITASSLPNERKDRISRLNSNTISTNNYGTGVVPSVPRLISELSFFMNVTNAKGTVFTPSSSSSSSIYLTGYPVPLLCRIPCWISLSDIVRDWPLDTQQSQVWKLSENKANIDISIIGNSNSPSNVSSLSFHANYHYGLTRLQQLLTLRNNQRKFICAQVNIHADGTVIFWDSVKTSELHQALNPNYDPSIAGVQIFQPVEDPVSLPVTTTGTFLGALNLSDSLDISYTRAITLPKYAIDIIVTGLGILTLVPSHPQLNTYLFTKLQEGYLCRTVTSHALARSLSSPSSSLSRMNTLPIPSSILTILGNNLNRKLKLQIRVTKLNCNTSNDLMDNWDANNSLALMDSSSSSSSSLPRLMILGTTLWKRGKFRTAYQPRQLRIHLQLPIIVPKNDNTVKTASLSATNTTSNSKKGSTGSSSNGTGIFSPSGNNSSSSIESSSLDTLIDTLHLPIPKISLSTGKPIMSTPSPVLTNLPYICYNLALRCYSSSSSAVSSSSSSTGSSKATTNGTTVTKGEPPYSLAQLGQMNDTEIKLDYTKNGNVRGSILLWSKGQPRILAVLQEVGAGVAGGNNSSLNLSLLSTNKSTNTSTKANNSNSTDPVDWKGKESSSSNFRKLLLSFTKSKASSTDASSSSSTISNRIRSASRDRSDSLIGITSTPSNSTTTVWAPTYRFALIMPDRTWHLAADSADMARKWIALLSLFTVSRETTLTKTLTTSSYSNNDLPLPALPNSSNSNNGSTTNNTIISRKPFNINVMDDAYRISTSTNIITTTTTGSMLTE